MNNKLFVGNLPYNTTDEQMKEFFQQAGTVVSAQVVVDKMTGRSKGFGFVEMSSGEEAQNAVDTLNNKDFNGRPISVSEARPKPAGAGRFGGGGGGGGYNDR